MITIATTVAFHLTRDSANNQTIGAPVSYFATSVKSVVGGRTEKTSTDFHGRWLIEVSPTKVGRKVIAVI